MPDQPSTGETPVSKPKEELLKEAKRLEESTFYSSKGHFVASEIWSQFHLWIGIPTAVLAAVAATSAFANRDMTAGVVSIVIAGLSALSTFLNPNEKAAAHFNAGNSYDALRDKIRIFWAIDCWQENSDKVLTERLKDLSEQKAKLNHSVPQIPSWAYRLAKRGIEAGEGSFQIDTGGEEPRAISRPENRSTLST